MTQGCGAETTCHLSSACASSQHCDVLPLRAKVLQVHELFPKPHPKLNRCGLSPSTPDLLSPGPKSYAEAVKVLHSAASATGARPAPVVLLDAILVAQILGQEQGAAARSEFFDRLAGGGSPGRQWKLIYTASPSALRDLRGIKNKDKRQKKVALLQGMVNQISEALPWTSGLYVDAFVTAIQRFDAATFENENGVFAVLGWDGVRFSVKGPFKWPQPEVRAVCAFQPTTTCVRVVGWEKVFSLEPGPIAFEDTPPTKLPFFKFVHVDDRVAVAIGRSGGAAVWARLDNGVN